MSEQQIPRVDVRQVETWWWRNAEKHSYGTTEALARRAQHIFGGDIEVIRQTITTVTAVSVIPHREDAPPKN